MQRIDVEERRVRLALRHRIAAEARASSALETARSLVALHSTDPGTVFLSVHARSDGLSPEAIEHELYEHRALVRMLGMRRTLFVVPRELVSVVNAASARSIAKRERRRLEQMVADSGISTQPPAWVRRAMATALGALQDCGEAFTSDLAASVPALAKRLRVGAGTKWETTQSAASRILPQLAMEGRIVRARPRSGWTNGHYRWTPMAAWLGTALERLDTAPAQVALVSRWLTAFGPATETDLRWWTGWTAREARAALAAVPHAVVDLGHAAGYVHADDLAPVGRPEPSAALLPTLDPTTMGWKERSWYLGPYEKLLFDTNGNGGPTVWWDGRVVGAWSQRRDGEVVYRLLEDVGGDAVSAIEAEAERLAAWIGEARVAPGFFPPFQRKLAT